MVRQDRRRPKNHGEERPCHQALVRAGSSRPASCWRSACSPSGNPPCSPSPTSSGLVRASFPFWLSLIGSGFSLALLIGVIRAPADPPDAEPILPHGYGARRIGAIIGTLAVTTLLMEVLGFQLAMLGFNVVLLVALGERRWIAIGLFAVAGSFGVYYVFTRWLDVLLPAGLLGL